ncbi:hypothetical protein EIL87_06895 [Saccharopolyspora rhizosphaerae]|uniref:Putative host cell surface-exposed lipoprotein Ltp-like HTH region domain-containing protein n=1 Tax=Saccharopolyspora rhizosphaerae TaxID=2492662 RepID=A0A3R8R4B6_9PSEU|nr:Ltp family lipoprotein [Saccharopolyspora rhizosphaerae]RRO17991.1 hypothetical protein EIL87_06895 [Saccharopolyspora rhizosphaerae]
MNTRARIAAAVAAGGLIIGAAAGCTAEDDAAQPSYLGAEGFTGTAPHVADEEEPPSPSPLHEQALGAARAYVDSAHFSESGLTEQLATVDQFPPDVASWAAAHSGADWNAEALESAEEYRGISHASGAEVRDRLITVDRFTPEQAEYATSHLGG